MLRSIVVVTMQTGNTFVLLAVITMATGCRPGVDFDGLYRVESYAEGDCTGAGAEIEPEFSQFRIREREWLGVTIYPLYPCDGSGSCATENHATWGLVTIAEDSHEISMTTAYNHDDSCILSSIEVLIDEHADPERDAIVLERHINEVAIEPYVAHECTTDRAKSMKSRMRCVEILRLVGEPEPGM